MQDERVRRWTWLAIALGTAYVFWDAARPFNLTDEFWYAQITREMLSSGDWVTPHLGGVPDYNKPPLYFWLSAPFAAVFPDEIAMRIVPGLGFLGILLVLRRLVARELGARAALLAIAIFALTADHLLHHGYKSGVVDGLLNLEMALIFALAVGLREHPARLRWIGVLLGLTFLTKTAFAVFPAGLVAVQLWGLRRERVISPLLVAQSVLLAAAIGGGWLLALAAANGADALAYHFGDQIVGRFLGDQAGYAASGRVTGRAESLFVLRHLFTWAQPWCWIALAALGRLLALEPAARPRMLPLGALWLVGVVVVFSASGGRWPWYTSSVHVPAAILGGWLLDRWLAGEWNLWTRTLVPLSAAALLMLPSALGYNPFLRQATCTPLDGRVALQLAAGALLLWATLRTGRSGSLAPAAARLQLAGVGLLALASAVWLESSGLAPPLYTGGGRCRYAWPEPGAAVPVQLVLGVAISGIALVALWLVRRSVPLGCVAALLLLGATYVLTPTLRHGFGVNERAEVRWMRDAIARGEFDAAEGRVLEPTNRYLGVILLAEFGDRYEVEYDARRSRTTVRPRRRPLASPHSP